MVRPALLEQGHQAAPAPLLEAPDLLPLWWSTPVEKLHPNFLRTKMSIPDPKIHLGHAAFYPFTEPQGITPKPFRGAGNLPPEPSPDDLKFLNAVDRCEAAEALLKEAAQALESEIEAERHAVWLKIRKHFDR